MTQAPNPTETTNTQVTTVLLTMAIPEQGDPAKFQSKLPKHTIVADPGDSRALWALLLGLQEQGHIVDGGATSVWSGREIEPDTESPADSANDQRGEKEDPVQEPSVVRIPDDTAPVQDCVDLATFLIRTTMTLQGLAIGVRGVGGPIDVAVITPTVGLEYVQRKNIHGEDSHERE